MLDITSFAAEEFSLIYHGANRYRTFNSGNHIKLIVDVMDSYCENIIKTLYYECSSLSIAIANIEAMESGEEV